MTPFVIASLFTLKVIVMPGIEGAPEPLVLVQSESPIIGQAALSQELCAVHPGAIIYYLVPVEHEGMQTPVDTGRFTCPAITTAVAEPGQ